MDSLTKITSHIVQASDANQNNVLFGGRMMEWVDEAGAIFAREFTKEPRMVTLLFEKFEFHKPVPVGAIVDFYVSNVSTGNTSISFNIIAKLSDGTHVVTTRCVFVCVDENLKKKNINWSMDETVDSNDR